MREPGEISATCHHWSPRTQPLTSPCSLASALLMYHIFRISEMVPGSGTKRVLGYRLTTKRPARRSPESLQNHGSGSTRPYIKPSISKGSPRTPLQRGSRGILEELLDKVIEFLYTPATIFRWWKALDYSMTYVLA